MRTLKVLVVALGVLLVAGVVSLAALVAMRVGRGAPAASLARASSGPVHETLPAGSRVLAAELVGDRLMVRVTLAEGGDELLLFDARTGAPVAVIAPAPPQ